MSNSIIVFLTKDLFFLPMMRVSAERAGCVLVFAPSLGNSRLESVDPNCVALCVIDLTICAADQLDNLARQIRDRYPNAKIAAFGPHVHENSLQTASDLFDHVVTRGQLNKNSENYIRRWLDRPAKEDDTETDSPQVV